MVKMKNEKNTNTQQSIKFHSKSINKAFVNLHETQILHTRRHTRNMLSPQRRPIIRTIHRSTNKTSTAVSIAWTLAMGGLVWFMQLGFAFLGAGFIRQKNQVNYWTKSYIDFSVGVVIFALVGFGNDVWWFRRSFPHRHRLNRRSNLHTTSQA